MSFWDNFSNSINRAGQTAIQKTKDMAGIASLKSEIAESQRKIGRLEQEMGRIVMDSNFFGATPEQVEQILSSDDAQKKTFDVAGWKEILSRASVILSEEKAIAEKEDKVNALQGVVICPNCKKAVPKGNAYCPNCGTKLPEAPAPAEEAPAQEAAAEEAPAEEVPAEEVSVEGAPAEEAPAQEAPAQEVEQAAEPEAEQEQPAPAPEEAAQPEEKSE